MVCLLIATLFIDAFIGTNLRWFVGGLFVLSMFSLSGGIICFLREVHIAMLRLRIGSPIKTKNTTKKHPFLKCYF